MAKPKKMPKQKPGESRQDYGTPRDLLDSLEQRFGFIEVDLAARADNAKAASFITPEEDSLKTPWVEKFGREKVYFLNPPFGLITPWARKCSEEALRLTTGRIIFHVPAAVGSKWFANYIFGKSLVLIMRQRPTYEGETQPYIKDTMCCVYGEPPGLELWNWKGKNKS